MNTTILAYCDKNSARPGEIIQFMVSAEGCETYRADIVRLGCCDAGQDFPPYRETVIDTQVNASYPARTQAIAVGSSVHVLHTGRLSALEQLSMLVYVWPTRLGAGRQALMGSWQEDSGRGYGLEIDAHGHLGFRVGSGENHSAITLSEPLVERRWQLVGVSFEAESGRGRLFCQPQPDKQFPVLPPLEREFTIGVRPATDIDEFRLAAWPGPRHGERVLTTCHFDGKLDRPRLFRRMMEIAEIEGLVQLDPDPSIRNHLVAAWDFSRDIDSDRVSDISDR